MPPTYTTIWQYTCPTCDVHWKAPPPGTPCWSCGQPGHTTTNINPPPGSASRHHNHNTPEPP